MLKFKPYNNTDTFFTVNGIKTHSKVDAVHKARGDLSLIKFHWMEDTWDNTDWTDEPKDSWKTLLKIRCQQIRDKYPYIALWYSGGYDSYTILKAFIDNNILLDEILIYDKRDFFNDPEVEIAINHAELVKKLYYPDLKINVVRIDYKVLLKFYENQDSDWVFHPGSGLKITKTSRYFATNIMDDFLLTSKNISNRGNIMGVDKPKVLLRDGKWYGFMVDVAVDYIGANQENFYFSNELPELHIKQCHMVVDWFNSLPELDEELVHDVQGKGRAEFASNISFYERWNLAMGREKLKTGHIWSINGYIKNFHLNDETSLDNIKIYEHIKNNDTLAFNIYNSGLQLARTYDSGSSGKLADKTLISKQYYIKDRTL
jgi:hypothetical protein